MGPAGDSALSKQPKASSSRRKGQSRSSALREEIAKAAPGTQNLEPSILKPGKEADSQQSDGEAKMGTDEQSSVATRESINAGVKKEPDADQQEQLIVKLKHKGDKASDLASENQRPVPASSGDSAQCLGPREASDTIAVKVPVKQEPEEDEGASRQKADSDGPKTESENDNVSALQPLDEFTQGESQAEIFDHDTETEATQRVDFPGPVQERSGGGDGRQDNTAIPLSDDRNSPYQLPGLDVTGLDCGKDTQPVSLEQDRVSKAKDEPQSGAVSTQAVVDRMSAPEEHDGVVYDIGNWMPGDGEDSQEVPRPNKAGDPWDERDQRGMIKDTARSDFETAKLDVVSGPAVPLSQHHQAFANPVHFTNKSASPHLSYEHGVMQSIYPSGFQHHSSPKSRHGSQQPMSQYKQPYLTPNLERQRQLRAQIEEKKRQLENARRLHEESQRQARQVSSSYGLTQSLSGTPPPFPIGPLSYPRATQTGYQQPMSGYNNATYQFHTQALMPCVAMGSILSQASLLTPGYNLQSHRPPAPGINRRLPGPYAPPGPPAPPGQGFRYHDSGDEEEASDDDEPLRTRVRRHLSITSQDSVISASPAPLPSTRNAHATQREDSSDIEFLRSKSETKAAGVKNPIRLAQPGPSSPPSNANTDDPTAIDWKLPRFDLQRQPPEKGSDIPSVKISLPNLVREELLLSPDHSAQEIHLLLNVFLPSQRALPAPDPEPAAAVLNFHTIALMVIEVFVQYEIGDELGTGRGHWHEGHDRGEEEYVRVRSAEDANVDEIFWAVVDRWRAGVESRKKSLEVLRGVQEFCDVALDVIFWVKEHGLLGEEEEQQQQRMGKKKAGNVGGKRGRAAAAEEEDGEGDDGEVPEGVSRGKVPAKSKRGTAGKPNQVQPRKRAKTQATEVKKKGRAPTTPGVTIVKRTR